MPPPELSWYCIRSKPRRQNLAAAHLRSLEVEVFNPQLRRPHASARAQSWRTEPLFPNYLFARFEVQTAFRRVRYAQGVSDIVCFGQRWAVVPEAEIERLRAQWGPAEALEVPPALAPGARVSLCGALFHGVQATVLCLLPARQRVRVLLEFLGGMQEAEVEAAMVVPELAHPLAQP